MEWSLNNKDLLAWNSFALQIWINKRLKQPCQYAANLVVIHNSSFKFYFVVHVFFEKKSVFQEENECPDTHLARKSCTEINGVCCNQHLAMICQSKMRPQVFGFLLWSSSLRRQVTVHRCVLRIKGRKWEPPVTFDPARWQQSCKMFRSIKTIN